MDPLSVAASLIAVTGAAATVGRALHTISDIRHAPDQLAALTNEVADLQVVLETAKEVVESRVETAQDCGRLAHIVRRANQILEKLDHLIHHELVRKGAAQKADDKVKASHTGFLKCRGKLRALKDELRQTKLSLLIAVGTLTFADVSRLKLCISDIELAGPLISDDMHYAEEQMTNKMGDETIDTSTRGCPAAVEENPCLSESSDTVSNEMPVNTETHSTDRTMQGPGVRTIVPVASTPLEKLISDGAQRKQDNSQIRIEASVLPLYQCNRFCLCQCHKVTNMATPNSLEKLVGRLFVGYTGVPLLSYRKCNRLTCRHDKSQMRIRIAYLFPLWFALRLIALTITKASTTFMWTLSFPAVTQTGSAMLIFTSLGSIDKVQELLVMNAAVLNAIDVIANKSPLHVAIQFHQIELVSFLVQRGADMFVQDCNKKTPLDTYYENYFTATTEESRMTTLLPVFEKYDVCDHWNLEVIHLIVLGCSPIDLWTYMTISDQDIDVVDSFGRTALMWAAWRGDDTSFSTLLHFGANPHASSFDGNSVLMYATYGGSINCLKLVLGAGADIDHTNHVIVTPAMVRPKIGDNRAIATVRVVRGASIEASRQQRLTPLYVAALTNRIESLIYLLDSGATTDVASWECSTPLSVAISLNHHRVIEELIKRTPDVNVLSGFKTSYLTYVAMFGNERTMRLFMDARPAMNVNHKDMQGRTAQDHLWERLHSTGPMDAAKERLAAAFQQLVHICAEEYERAQGYHRYLRDLDENPEDEKEDFYDALEDNSPKSIN